MKNYNFLFIILLGITMSNCGGTKKGENTLFTFDDSKLKPQYQTQESLELGILNTNSKEVDSVIYFNNDIKIGSKKGLDKLVFNLKDQKFGNQNLKAVVYFDDDYSEATTQIELVSNVTPKLLKYTIVNTYPHDIEAYTQGLEFYRDTLYEGTGNGQGASGKRGISSLRKTDYKTGKVEANKLKINTFEGLTLDLANDKIIQLLKILSFTAHAEEITEISKSEFEVSLDEHNTRRIDQIYSFSLNNFTRPSFL